LRKITLFIFILWAAIGMSVAAIYIPISSDPAEAQKPVFETKNPLEDQNSIIPLQNAINSTLTNGTDVHLSLDVLSPLVALVHVQLDSLTGNAPFVSLIQVKLDSLVTNSDNTDKVTSSDKTEPKPTEPPKDVDTKTNSTIITNTTNTTGTNTTIPDTNTTNTTDTNTTIPDTNSTDTNGTDTNTTDTNATDPTNGNKYLVDNFSLEDKEYAAEITNQNDNVVGDGYYEISTNAASNHLDVLQSGTFAYALGTFTISDMLTFNPVDNTEYYIHVYTNYPEDDNRVSKDNTVFIYSENESA